MPNVIYGTAGPGIILGTNAADEIWGRGGNDILVGGAGNDWLIGGAGADSLSGEAGIDGVSYCQSEAGVSVDLASGTGRGGDAQGDRLESIESVDGTNYDDVLIGNSGANTLRGGRGTDILRGGAGADTLDGGTGLDMSSYFDSASGVTVNLATGKVIGGTATGDILVSIEAINGSAYADAIAGDGGFNVLWGGAGGDALRGAGGSDDLTGGAGADRFVFGGASESPPGSGDRITDFSHTQGDRIDLAQIDANGSGIAGNGSFSFISTAAYTGVAGQLRYVLVGSDLLIAGDVNGDKVSDFNIVLSNVGSIQASDFML